MACLVPSSSLPENLRLGSPLLDIFQKFLLNAFTSTISFVEKTILSSYCSEKVNDQLDIPLTVRRPTIVRCLAPRSSSSPENTRKESGNKFCETCVPPVQMRQCVKAHLELFPEIVREKSLPILRAILDRARASEDPIAFLHSAEGVQHRTQLNHTTKCMLAALQLD